MAKRSAPGRNDDRVYRHPIPSRADILEALKVADVPLNLRGIGAHFSIRGQNHLGSLKNRLQAMVRDGQLIRNRAKEYCLVERLDLVTGRVIAHRDGYGFLEPDDGSDDLYLSAREMRTLMHGDRAAVRIRSEDERGREGQLVEVLARALTQVVGRFETGRGVPYVVPDNPKLGSTVLIPRSATGGAHRGQFVKVEITEYPDGRSEAVGKVIEILGDEGTEGIEIELAVLAHGLPHEWPDTVVKEMAHVPARVPARDKSGRVDLRDLPLVTIDGADAKDFDDAVYCESRDEGWRLLVAIADVSHYVQPGTALDEEAQRRGTSVYFPGRVIPMLPEQLSNGLCSLNPKVDRLCMVCEMSVSRQGKVTASKFYDGVMRSAARLTYSQAQEIIDQGSGKRHGRARELANLRAVYEAFAKARRRRGALDFDIPAVKFDINARGHISGVSPAKRMTTHRIVEECMIAANVEAAKRLRRVRLPGLYRVHEPPSEERFEELALFLRGFGAKMGSAKDLTPKRLDSVLKQFANRPERELIDAVVLRAMAQAQYQPKNVGHFGLALPIYSHFTSPIRRYPDLLLHRALKASSGRSSRGKYPYNPERMEHLGELTSRFERRAEDAVRDVEEKLKCEYMSHHIGEHYAGVITGVVPFGLFVRLDSLQIDGLVHVSALPHDYYEHDKAKQSLTGRHEGKRFRLMDAIEVRIASVDTNERTIDLVPAAATMSPPKRRRRSRRK